MVRYWVKNDDSIEGPFEDKLLKFLDGFTEETLVCPDQPGIEEVWVKASEVEALQELLGLQKVPEVTARQKPPELIPAEPMPEIAPETGEQSVAEEPISVNHALPAEPPPSYATAIPEADHPAGEVQPQYEKTLELHEQEHQAPAAQKNRGVLLAITGLAACVSLFIVWKKIPGIHKFKNLNIIESWYDKRFNQHPQKSEPPLMPVQARTEPAKTPVPIAKTPNAALEKKPQAAQAYFGKENKPKKTKVAGKRKTLQKSAPKIVKKETPPQKEAALKTQKYILPGVPAPNINQSSASQESPNQDTSMKEPKGTGETRENQKKEPIETRQNQNNDGNKNNGTSDEELNEMERMTKGFLNQ